MKTRQRYKVFLVLLSQRTNHCVRVQTTTTSAVSRIMARTSLVGVIALSLLVNAFCLPTNIIRRSRDVSDNEVSDTKETDLPSSSPSAITPDPYDEDDDDDEDDFPETSYTSTSGGGSNIFSLLKFATALFPSSGGSHILMSNIVHDIKNYNSRLNKTIHYRDVNVTESQNRAKRELTTQKLQRQEIESNNVESTQSESSSSSDSEDGNEMEEISEGNADSDENNAAEESVETSNEGNSSKQDSDAADDSNESDYDSDEPPGGDGQGGGILGLLAGLSGGEDGESDLGTLLAAVSGIVLNLSGDGLDLNGIIASAVGLFAGLLSEGEENPGAVVASYLLTTLDTITGGGANNNGAFFGKFLSNLVKGISAAVDSEESSEEDSEEKKMITADSFGFFASLIMGLLGDMSKGSSGGGDPK